MEKSIKNSIFVEILRVILAVAYLVLFGIFTQNLYFDISCFVAAGLIIVLMMTVYGVTVGTSYRPIMMEEILAEAPEDEEQ